MTSERLRRAAKSLVGLVRLKDALVLVSLVYGVAAFAPLAGHEGLTPWLFLAATASLAVYVVAAWITGGAA
jgi:hypothetical protein